MKFLERLGEANTQKYSWESTLKTMNSVSSKCSSQVTFVLVSIILISSSFFSQKEKD